MWYYLTTVFGMCVGFFTFALISINRENKEIQRLRKAISRLLFSYNRHWIKMSLKDCSGTSPSEIAASIINAEDIPKSEAKDKRHVG